MSRYSVTVKRTTVDYHDVVVEADSANEASWKAKDKVATELTESPGWQIDDRDYTTTGLQEVVPAHLMGCKTGCKTNRVSGLVTH